MVHIERALRNPDKNNWNLVERYFDKDDSFRELIRTLEREQLLLNRRGKKWNEIQGIQI